MAQSHKWNTLIHHGYSLSSKPLQKAWAVRRKESTRVAVQFLQLIQWFPAFHFYSKQKGEKHWRLYVTLQNTSILRCSLELKSQVKVPLSPTKTFRIKAELCKQPNVNRTIWNLFITGAKSKQLPHFLTFRLETLLQAGMSNQDCYQQHELKYLLALTLVTAKSRAVGVAGVGAQCLCTVSSALKHCKLLSVVLQIVNFMPLHETRMGGVTRWWHWTVSGAQELSHSPGQRIVFLAW